MTSTLRFEGQVAVITGAGRGLGRAHAMLLAERGAAVVVNDVDAAADSVAEEIHRAGGKAAAVQIRIDEPDAAEAVVEAALDRYGRLDILINNAGIARAVWETVIRVNLTGSYRMIEAAWPRMVGQRYGRIINTTSAAGLFGFAAPEGEPFDFYAYGAAKMGIVGLTQSLAFAGEPYGIKVNAVSPVANTQMAAANPDAKSVHWLRRYFPPDLVFPAVAYLAHAECPVTGQVFSVGGGRIARVFIGEGRGYSHPELSPEDVRNQFETVCELDDHVVPLGTAEEMHIFDTAVRPHRHVQEAVR